MPNGSGSVRKCPNGREKRRGPAVDSGHNVVEKPGVIIVLPPGTNLHPLFSQTLSHVIGSHGIRRPTVGVQNVEVINQGHHDPHRIKVRIVKRNDRDECLFDIFHLAHKIRATGPRRLEKLCL